MRALLLAVMTCLTLTACSSLQAPQVDPAAALATAQDVCRVYDMLPADKRTTEGDRACYVVKRICIDPKLEAPPPSPGNKVVDAGTDGP